MPEFCKKLRIKKKFHIYDFIVNRDLRIGVVTSAEENAHG